MGAEVPILFRRKCQHFGDGEADALGGITFDAAFQLINGPWIAKERAEVIYRLFVKLTLSRVKVQRCFSRLTLIFPVLTVTPEMPGNRKKSEAGCGI